jgi:hypothetical protein
MTYAERRHARFLDWCTRLQLFGRDVVPPPTNRQPTSTPSTNPAPASTPVALSEECPCGMSRAMCEYHKP